MAEHDIIDNKEQKLAEQIQRILPDTDKARFAVGYLFLSGLQALGRDLGSLRDLRILIGNTSSKQTIEQLSEIYRRLDLVEHETELTKFAKRADHRKRAEETAENLRDTISLMDQSYDNEALIRTLIRMFDEKRIMVRVYTKSRLHAKAYIFDFANPNPGNEGIAIVGSSNLTLSGLTNNTELNVVVHDKGSISQKGLGNHGALVKWFENLWDESEDFSSHLMDELEYSWAMAKVTPYDIYMKTLFELVKERLEYGGKSEILWEDEITRTLSEFQRKAVQIALRMIGEYGGCFVSDVVGMGKSFIGAAIVKHFERTEGARALIICPKTLEEMWDRYREIYDLNARVLPMSMLQMSEMRGADLEDEIYRYRNFVLIDESHNFRHHSNQRYEVLTDYLSANDKKVCLLTATPRNSRIWDIYNQIKLFHPEDKTDLPIEPANLREYFKKVEKRENRLQDLLMHLLIRRRRRDILRWYGYAEGTGAELRKMSNEEVRPYLSGEKRAYVMVAGRHEYFPQRKLGTLRYSIEETYHGLYQEIRHYLGKPRGDKSKPVPNKELTYARYGLWHYVKPELQKKQPYSNLHRAGFNLRGLIRTMLFKRFESSVYAFRESLKRLMTIHGHFIKSLDMGLVPAGDKAQKILYESDACDEDQLFNALEEVSKEYKLEDFDEELLREHIDADRKLFEKMLSLVEPITPDEDDKYQELLVRLGKPPVKNRKVLVFTQYADTAIYLFNNLNPDGRHDDIEVIYGFDKSKSRIVGRFAPKANPQFVPKRGQPEIRLLVTTDVLAEGLNLQDCSIVINYDLHWNPVRLIQRVGRVDRIGSEHEVIWSYNFLPETGIEKNLHIKEVLKNRIQEIHDTIGEDAAILDESERVNEDAMYAIYDKESLDTEEAEEDFIDISNAEEFFRSLKEERPEEFERIANLRNAIRSAKASETKCYYAFCQSGRYNQLQLVDDKGTVISRDLPTVLNAIKCGPGAEARELPDDYNDIIVRVKKIFDQQVKHRQSRKKHAADFTLGQRYIIRELQALFTQTADENRRALINMLEEGFRVCSSPAIRKELNLLRRNDVTGDTLIKTLSDLYSRHSLTERVKTEPQVKKSSEVPRIICSEALV